MTERNGLIMNLKTKLQNLYMSDMRRKSTRYWRRSNKCGEKINNSGTYGGTYYARTQKVRHKNH